MKTKAYVFPYSSKVKMEHSNPYIVNLMSSLGHHFNVINKESPSATGVLDILRKIRKIDIVFFNWIENIPERKAGIIQVTAFYIILFVSKILKIKIVFTLHNKLSHSKTKLRAKKQVFKSVIKHSDFIITHSTEGKTHIKEKFPRNLHKTYVYHHPLDSKPILSNTNKDKTIDILLWGSISPYKGILEFVEYLSQNRNNFKGVNITIAGKFNNTDYYEKVKSIGENLVNIENRFLDDIELEHLLHASRIVLFTYNSDSVLSSGALMKSLESNCLIIGPNKGAFLDLAKIGIIETYKNYNEIYDIYKKINSEIQLKALFDTRASFIDDNCWNNYVNKLYNLIAGNA